MSAGEESEMSEQELLRLAKKAWPDTAADVREPDEEDPLSVDYTEHDCTARVHNQYEEDSCGLTITHPERAREALHAALLVLAGELSPRDLELLARLRSHPNFLDVVEWIDRAGGMWAGHPRYQGALEAVRLLLQLLRGDTGQGG